jgi:HTH-type transcriptional regulator, competence development regulator
MKKTPTPSAGPSLGAYLSSIRADRGLTLREVQEKTGDAVSNAYLSQIERDLVPKPSARVLGALADVYRIDGVNLLERAGYVEKPKRELLQRRAGSSTFADHNLTPDEENAMLEYLRWYRHQNRPRK